MLKEKLKSKAESIFGEDQSGITSMVTKYFANGILLKGNKLF